MPRQQRVPQRAEAHETPAHRALRQMERHHAARDNHVGHRRAPDIEESR